MRRSPMPAQRCNSPELSGWYTISLTCTVMALPPGPGQLVAHRQAQQRTAYGGQDGNLVGAAVHVAWVDQRQAKLLACLDDQELHRGVHGDHVGWNLLGRHHVCPVQLGLQLHLARKDTRGHLCNQGFDTVNIQRRENDLGLARHGSTLR